MKFKTLPSAELIRKLESPRGKVRMILDTDAFNEVDDQFAIVHALFSPDKVDLLSIYAAPFHNDRSEGAQDGMERSYHEIEKVLRTAGFGKRGMVFKGSRSWLPGPFSPVQSAAATDFIEKARQASPADPLYAVMIGAPTNIASALIQAPDIVNRVVLIFIGGQAIHYPHARDFNLEQDPHAARLLLDCGAPLVLIPCMGVASNLTTTIPEIDFHLRGQNDLCNYLTDIVRNYKKAQGSSVWSKVIWDIAATSWLIVPQALRSHLRPSPILTDNLTWSFDPARHLIRYVDWVERDLVFNDVFQKLRSCQKG